MLQFILGQGQWELVFGKKKKKREKNNPIKRAGFCQGAVVI